MEHTYNRGEQTKCALNDTKDAQPTRFLDIVALNSTVYAPVIHNVHGASGITLTQNVGANISEAETKDAASVITNYKESILSMYEYTREYTSRPGEHVLLADRYVDPLIIKTNRVKKQREKEMRTQGQNLFNLNTYDANQSIGIDKLFTEEEGATKKCPKAVILQGNSGNGKSFIAQKIILDWAKGDLFADIFDVVFHLRCSEFNGISGDKSLVELLNCEEEMNQILKDKDKRILFLVDGFDELRCSLSKRALPVRVDIRGNPEDILSSLLKGNMLRDSFLLVTTRSTSTEKLSKVLKCPHRFTEIMGFSKEGVQEYFQKFFEDKDLATLVYEQVKTHDVLYTACFSPVMCWLICNVFKQKADMGAIMIQMKSTTTIFIRFVFTLLDHHCQELDQSQKFILLKKLGELAKEGTMKGKILFEKHFVPDEILKVVGLPFLCTFQHKKGTHLKEMFSFIHLCFQEFFTALYYILLDKTECKKKIKQLLSSVSDGFRNSHLLPVIRFLFGLCSKNVTRLILEKHQAISEKHEGISEKHKEISSLLKKWLQTSVRKGMNIDLSFIFQCLYEVNDSNFVRNIMDIWETTVHGIDFCLSSAQKTEFHAAAYCLQFCTHIRYLELDASSMHVLKMFEEALSKCSKLGLTLNSVSDDDVDYLISVMGKGKKLKHLWIEESSLSDHSVEMIVKSLNKQKSVTDIYLTVKTINHNNTDIIMNFCKTLKEKQQFRMELTTSENNEESLCSYYVVDNYRNYQITTDYRDMHSSPETGLGLLKISVGVDSMLKYHNDIKKIFHISYDLKEFESPVFEENVEALLSVLHSIPGLKQVELLAKNMSMKSAVKILSFSQEKLSRTCQPDFFRFRVERLKCINDENVCFLAMSTEEIEYVKCVVLCLDFKIYRGSLQDAQPRKSTPDFSMKIFFMKVSTFKWEGLFETCNKLMASQERTSFLDNQMDTLLSLLQSIPSMYELDMHLESLPEKWAVGVIYFVQACSSLVSFKLSVGSEGDTLGIVKRRDEPGSTAKTYMTFGRSYLYPGDHDSMVYVPNWADRHIFKTTDCSGVMSCIILSMGVRFCTDTWSTFFHHYNQLKDRTELCPEYEHSLDVVLSHINTLPALEEVDMALPYLTVHGASSIMNLIQTSSSLCRIDVVRAMRNMEAQDWMSFQGDNEGDSNCSDFSASNGSTESSYDYTGSCNSDMEEFEDDFQMPPLPPAPGAPPRSDYSRRYDSDMEEFQHAFQIPPRPPPTLSPTPPPGSLPRSDYSGSCDSDIEEFDDTVLIPPFRRVPFSPSSDMEMENYEFDLCSELRISMTTENKFKLSLRCNGSDPDTKAIFAYISLTFSKTTKGTEICWRNFFQAYYETKGLTKRDSTYITEKLNALMSFLHNVPGLEMVEIGTHSLNENCASWTLLLAQSNPNIHSICLQCEQNMHISNAISSLTIKRCYTDAMVTVEVDLPAKTMPSLIYLNLPCSEICNLDCAGLLYRLRWLGNLNDTSPEYETQINELISFLHSVPHLQKVKLGIEKLTTALAKRILSLKTWHRLSKIFFRVTDSSVSMLVEDAISELEKKRACDGHRFILIRGASFYLDKQLDTFLSLLQSMPYMHELYIYLESLPEKLTVGVINFLQACSSLGNIKLIVGTELRTLGIIKGADFDKTCMTWGCCHLGYGFHGLRPTDYNEHIVLPCIMLIMDDNTNFCTDSWATFFHHCNQLKATTELPEYEQSLDVVLSHINTLPSLEEVDMALPYLSVHGAESIMNLIQTSSSLCKIDVVRAMRNLWHIKNVKRDWISSYYTGGCDSDMEEFWVTFPIPQPPREIQKPISEEQLFLQESPGLIFSNSKDRGNYKLDLCSELRISKTNKNKLKLSLKCNGSDPDTKAIFAYISLTLSKTTKETEICWRNFFQAYYETKGLTMRDNTHFTEKLNALVSFLHNVPGLEKVEFGTHSLNVNWASWILLLSHSNPNIHSVSRLLERNEEKDSNAGLSLITKRNFTDAMVTVKVNLLENTTPSLLHLKLPFSEICKLDGAGLLYRVKLLRDLNETSPEYDKQINELISFLHSVPHLQKVKLGIENLTTAWAKRILPLKTCHSLSKILVTTSSMDMLVEEAISELENNWTCDSCVVVIRGWRCINPITTCSHQTCDQECNKQVNLTFSGGHYLEVSLQDVYREKAEKKCSADVYADKEMDIPSVWRDMLRRFRALKIDSLHCCCKK